METWSHVSIAVFEKGLTNELSMLKIHMYLHTPLILYFIQWQGIHVTCDHNNS